jgi:hypothetical protein
MKRICKNIGKNNEEVKGQLSTVIGFGNILKKGMIIVEFC